MSTRAIAALLGFTFVTGLIDAASVLGLGHLFVANMTGNIVFLGFSLLGQGSVSLLGVALALFGFLVGAALGARLRAHARPAVIVTATLIEAFAAIALVTALPSPT